MRKIFLFFLLIFNLSFADEIVDRFQEKLNKIQSIEGTFIQKVYQNGFKNPEIFNGKIVGSKPFILKIEYFKPFKQIILVNKGEAILYTPDDNQAIVSKIDNNLIIAEIFEMILKNKPLTNSFSISTKKQNKESSLILIPKNNNEVSKIVLNIQNNDFIIKKIEVIDKEDNLLEIEFQNFTYYKNKLNIDLSLPKNVKIIRGYE